MKKPLIALLSLFFIIALIGCTTKKADPGANGHTITLKDSYGMVMNASALTETSHEEGTGITITLRILAGSEGILLDGEAVPASASFQDDRQVHEFVMPDHDVVIQTTLDGKTSDENDIIYYDNEVSEIVFTLNFDYELNDATYDLHKAFIEKEKLDELGATSIFYFKKSASIFMYFAKDADSASILAALEKIKTAEPSLLTIEREVNYLYDRVYMPNPAAYGFTDADDIPFTLETPSAILPEGIYRSTADLEAAMNAYYEANYDKLEIVAGKTATVAELEGRYDATFFASHDLVIPEAITTGSGSNQQELKHACLKDGKLYLFVKMSFPTIGTCDMQCTRFALSFAKGALPDPCALALLYRV